METATVDPTSPWGEEGPRLVLWVENVFWLPQLRKCLNLSSVKGLIPSLSTVGTTHSRDLYPKGVFGLGYLDVIAVLLNLVSSLVSLYFCLIGLVSRLLGLALQLQGLFQLLLKGPHLLLRRSQLLLVSQRSSL